MVFFPNAKINIGLFVTEKRTDGFHNLESFFYPVPFYDVVEYIESDGAANVNVSGISIDGEPDKNLVFKAYQLLKQSYDLPFLSFRVHKVIPVGAGLGGGSADAAFTLSMLNNHFKLGMSAERLKECAAKLGSDCPFFIENKPCLATGKGEILKTVEMNLKNHFLVILNPEICISTKEAYAGVALKKPGRPMSEIINMPLEDWKDHLFNSFEPSVFNKYPLIAELKELLYKSGAVFASMTGSGSSVFGIYKNPPADFKETERFVTWKGKL
jgi:4-diphosphocytidyl-2-C-methyl-D-erythritol kinase